MHRVLTGISADALAGRIDPGANTVAWLVWHLTRIQDDHVADVAGLPQVWTAAGWYDRFGLPFGPEETGFGQDSDDVAALDGTSAELLRGYHDAVHEQTLRFVAGRDRRRPGPRGRQLVGPPGDARGPPGQRGLGRPPARRPGVVRPRCPRTGMSAVAIVTGASSGIGEACARRLHEAGFVVHAVARRVEPMAELATMGVHTSHVDVTVDADLVALVDGVLAESGHVDVLVNNAGYGSYGALEDVPMDEARRQLEVNLVALARLTQLVLPSMREQRSGRIVNISSMGGRFGEPMGAWYHATKFAVEGLSDSLRMELAPFGIDVVVVQPGSISTQWGPLAAGQLLETSASGAYAVQAVRSAAVLSRQTGGRPTGSSPDVVARAVVAAATARRPHTRYRVGAYAKQVTAARKLLPDRLWDRTLARSYDVEARRRSGPTGERPE